VHQEATSPEGHRLRFTATGDDVHVLVQAPTNDPDETLTLHQVTPDVAGSVTMVDGTPLVWRRLEGDRGVEVDLEELARRSPWPLAFTVTRAVALPTPPVTE
jgi:hypothetical protein